MFSKSPTSCCAYLSILPCATWCNSQSPYPRHAVITLCTLSHPHVCRSGQAGARLSLVLQIVRTLCAGDGRAGWPRRCPDPQSSAFSITTSATHKSNASTDSPMQSLAPQALPRDLDSPSLRTACPAAVAAQLTTGAWQMKQSQANAQITSRHTSELAGTRGALPPA